MKANYNKFTVKEKVPGVDSVIVSVDFTNGVDNSVMIIGRKNKKGVVDICHAIQGEEAEALYYQLLGKEAQAFKDEVTKLRVIEEKKAEHTEASNDVSDPV